MFRFIRGKVFGGHNKHPFLSLESCRKHRKVLRKCIQAFHFLSDNIIAGSKFLWIKQAEGWEQQEVIIVAGISTPTTSSEGATFKCYQYVEMGGMLIFLHVWYGTLT